MDLLYVNPGMKTAEKNYRYYGGLADQLPCRISNEPDDDCDVVVLGRLWNNWDAVINKPTVCILHKPANKAEAKRRFCKNIDVVLHSVPKLDYGDVLFPYAADEVHYEDQSWYKDRIYDFGFSGALHEKHDSIRASVQEAVRKTDLRYFLNGSDKYSKRIPNYEDYRKRICQSRIWMATTGPCDDVGPRYYEIMASRTLLFCNRIPDEYKHILRNGVNCVEFSDEDDCIDKIKYYLNHDGERHLITENAYEDFIEYHTWIKRAEDLCCVIKSMLHTKIT